MPEVGDTAFLVLEPGAVESALAVAKLCNGHVWLGQNLMSESEHRSAVAQGHRVTRFNHAVTAADQKQVDEALETMKEHHPNVVIWVQSGRAGK